MRIRLVRKLASYLDGVDVSARREGDVFDLSRREAELLIAERWAEPFFEPPADEVRGVSFEPERAMAADRNRRRTLDQIRRFREAMETTSVAGQQHRRAEDRIREELHDARATTIHGD
ncbi:MAG TPA: hypothetical protein VKE51_33140 [Vicinamibacterales bacterium]|nr:hypothetical protein [Vicinamibacterales bacterium]